MYSSEDGGKIYQQRPLFNRLSLYPAKGWTDTITGYINEAKQLTHCILRNARLMGRPCAWFVTVGIEIVQTPDEITDLWAKASRNLRRKGIVALWVREPTSSNKVHYHLLIKDPIGEKDLRRVFKESLPNLQKPTPKGRRRGWHMKPQPITDGWRLAFYVTKAKISGRVNGQQLADCYAKKRRLFKPNLGIRKYGTIGEFWERPKAKLWQEIRDGEKRIADGLEMPNVKRLAAHAHELLDGFRRLEEVERSFGFWSESDAVQGWIESLLAGEWAEEAAENGG